MAATVSLVVRKFVDGNDNYRRALYRLIEKHPERDTIISQIEGQGVKYVLGPDTAPAKSIRETLKDIPIGSGLPTKYYEELWQP